MANTHNVNRRLIVVRCIALLGVSQATLSLSQNDLAKGPEASDELAVIVSGRCVECVMPRLAVPIREMHDLSVDGIKTDLE